MKYLVLDTETCGMYNKLNIDKETLKKLNKDKIEDINLLIEFSCILYEEVDNELKPLYIGNTLCKADIDPTPETMEKNHITPEMLKDKVPFNETKVFKEIKNIIENEEVTLIGHNINFDLGILNVFDINFNKCNIIDTLTLLKNLDKTNSPKRLTYLYYSEKIYTYIDEIIKKVLLKTKTKKKDLVLELHRSLYDCFVTVEVLNIIKNRNNKTLNELLEISNNKVLYELMPYGKYKDTPISELSNDYLIFFLKGNIEDENLKYTFEKEVEKRGGYKEVLKDFYITKLENILNEILKIENHNIMLKTAIEELINDKIENMLRFNYGKYENLTIKEVYEKDKGYVEFMFDNNKLNKYMKEWYLKEVEGTNE